MFKPAILATLIGFPSEPEDVVQDIFLKVIRIINKIDEINCGKTKGLLVIITRNTALDMVKSKERSTKVDLDDFKPFLEDDIPLPLEQIVNQQGYEKLIQCIGKPSNTYKTVTGV